MSGEHETLDVAQWREAANELSHFQREALERRRIAFVKVDGQRDEATFTVLVSEQNQDGGFRADGADLRQLLTRAIAFMRRADR